MEKDYTYNQAILGLMLLGARADGVFQPEEKKLIVELTSGEHVLSPEEYKEVISDAKTLDYDNLRNKVFACLNQRNFKEKLEAIYWLVKLLKIDKSTDMDGENDNEKDALKEALAELSLDFSEILKYQEKKKG